MRGLLGFRAQGMKASSSAPISVGCVYPAGSYTFIAPLGGQYKFSLWGGGSIGGTTGGGSGSFAQITRAMRKGETAAISVGAAAGASTVIFQSGISVQAGGGVGTGGGVATGGDVNLNGAAGGDGADGNPGGGDAGGAGGVLNGANSGGAGAPGYRSYRGGRGATSGLAYAATPGGGGSASPAGDTYTTPGQGLCFVERLQVAD